MYIYTEAGGYGTAIPITTTDADGAYTFYSLDVRRYTLNFVASGYRGEWFGGEIEQADAATFAVALGESVTGKDASLLPLDSISGTITAAGLAQQALAGATVSAFGTDGILYGSATTSEGGGYAIAGLQPGSYTVRVTPPRESTFVAQWWHHKGHAGAATVIKLEVDTAVTGTNVALAAGAAVSGRITDTVTGSAIGGAWVYAYAATTTAGISGGSVASAQADANGNYALTGLAAGSYTLQFSGGSAYGSDGYLREWWGNKSSRHGAVVFAVQAGKTSTAVDAALVPTASINGVVYAAGARNVGLNLATVSAVDADGHVVRSAATNGSGEYRLTGLEPGKYSLRFTAPAGTTFTTAWWTDAAKPGGHGVVRVTAGEVVNGKSVELATASDD